MENELLQVGGAVALIALTVRELFAYLKSKGTIEGGEMNKNIFQELQRMNNNHLHTIQEKIEEGNRQLVETIHRDNVKIIEVLGDIKGSLRPRR